MPAQPTRTTAREGTLPVRPWRVLLLILLVLLPVTVALAAPKLMDLPSAGTVQQTPGVHTHGPSDTPVCQHVGHHGKASVLVSDNREAELPAPADTAAAIPSQGPEHNRLTVAEEPLHAAPSHDPRPTLPVYLRTQRLRV